MFIGFLTDFVMMVTTPAIRHMELPLKVAMHSVPRNQIAGTSLWQTTYARATIHGPRTA